QEHAEALAGRAVGRRGKEITEASGQSRLVEAGEDVFGESLEHRTNVRIGGTVMRKEGLFETAETQGQVFEELKQLDQVRPPHPPVPDCRKPGGQRLGVETLHELRGRRAGDLKNLGDGGVNGLY